MRIIRTYAQIMDADQVGSWFRCTHVEWARSQDSVIQNVAYFFQSIKIHHNQNIETAAPKLQYSASTQPALSQHSASTQPALSQHSASTQPALSQHSASTQHSEPAHRL